MYTVAQPASRCVRAHTHTHWHSPTFLSRDRSTCIVFHDKRPPSTTTKRRLDSRQIFFFLFLFFVCSFHFVCKGCCKFFSNFLFSSQPLSSDIWRNKETLCRVFSPTVRQLIKQEERGPITEAGLTGRSRSERQQQPAEAAIDEHRAIRATFRDTGRKGESNRGSPHGISDVAIGCRPWIFHASIALHPFSLSSSSSSSSSSRCFLFPSVLRMHPATYSAPREGGFPRESTLLRRIISQQNLSIGLTYSSRHCHQLTRISDSFETILP